MRDRPDKPAHMRRPGALVAAALAVLALPVAAFAQADAQLPANATSRGYGSAWECDAGYRQDGEGCSGVEIPENALPTNQSWGLGWICRHGFAMTDRASCTPVEVPANAFLDDSGERWRCERGFRQSGNGCVEIAVPENGYLTGSLHDAGWDCERGFRKQESACVEIAVPENGYLTNASYGTGWACERGFEARGEACVAVGVPENGYLVDGGHAPNWRCERGFRKSGDECLAIAVPENAHLDHTGNEWDCDRPYRPSADECVLPGENVAR